MSRLMTAVVVTVILVLFGMQNSAHVPVSMIVGQPVQIRLVFLLATAAAVGFFISYIRSLGRELVLRREVRRLQQLCKTARVQRELAAEDEEG